MAEIRMKSVFDRKADFRYARENGIPLSWNRYENMLPQMDATDGLAAAVCHYFQTNNPAKDKKFTSWKDYMSKNPGKVRK